MYIIVLLFCTVVPQWDYYRDFPFRDNEVVHISSWKNSTVHLKYSVSSKKHSESTLFRLEVSHKVKDRRQSERRGGLRGGGRGGRCLEGWLGFTHPTQMIQSEGNGPFSARGSPRGEFNHLSSHSTEKQPADTLVLKDRYVPVFTFHTTWTRSWW